MTCLDISKALAVLKPGASWVFQNADLSTLVWLDQVQIRPTDDEIIAQINS